MNSPEDSPHLPALDVRKAIRGYRAGELPYDGMLRALAEAPALISIGSNNCGELLEATRSVIGGRWHDLYTSLSRCPGEVKILVDGAGTLRSLAPEALGVTIDRGSPDEYLFIGPYTTHLEAWGRYVHLERGLAGRSVWGPQALLLSAEWTLLLELQKGAVQAARHEGRLVVCTAPDTVAAAVDLGAKLGRRWMPCKVRSAFLGALLAGEQDVVFNPAGPRGPYVEPTELSEALRQAR